jgi:hypothetical protein
MSDLYTYVMKHDSGLAPNPFWGVCTLAVCTPNHQGSRTKPGDWIAGVSDKRSGHKLIYAMEVDERIHMNDYFHDARFAAKKANLDGAAQQRCGDNFYSQDRAGRWTQHPNPYHPGPECLAQDTRNPWVFVGRRFWYLGRKAIQLPADFAPMFGGRGARVSHPPDLVAAFRVWVEESLKKGMNALPRDFEGDGCSPPSRASRAQSKSASGTC